MSSTYRAICMNHDPAIEIDLADNIRDIDTALQLLPAVRESHPGCDLLIGRYSYPLVEVFCPPSELDNRRCPTFHSVPKRMDIDWLTLLYHARQVPAPPPLSEALAQFDRSCWGPRRVERLMRLVGDEYASSLGSVAIPKAAVRGTDVGEVRDLISRDFLERQTSNPIGEAIRRHGLSAVVRMSPHERAELRDALASADRSEEASS